MEDLLRLMPEINRARGYHLYDARGNRYLDLYLNRGRAILGHRPHSLAAAIKRVLDKGVLADYPSVYLKRLIKVLSGKFPDYQEFRVYRNWERARIALERHYGRTIKIHDPLMEGSGAKVALWRPFWNSPDIQPEILVPILPIVGAFETAVLGIRRQSGIKLPPGDSVSPVALVTLVRSLYNLIRAEEDFNPNQWEIFTNEAWILKGPYIIMKCQKSEYQAIFKHFLQRRIILSPYWPGPAVLPMEFSEKEMKPLLDFK